MKKDKKRQSPYARHGKREYIYSNTYQAWASQFRPTKASQRGVRA